MWLRPGEVHLWWMDLRVCGPHAELLESWLDARERERVVRLHSGLHRRRFVAAHGQMRAVLSIYLGVTPAAVCFGSLAYGKPVLLQAQAATGPAHDIEFNLSHSEEQGLLAITRGSVIGADIEVQHELRDLEELASSHFTGGELQDLHSLPEPCRHDAFFAAWTRKEAYVKALGAGLSVPLDGFEVSLKPDEPAQLRSIQGSPQAAAAWTLWAARPAPTSWAAVAVRHPSARVSSFCFTGVPCP